jgi:P27 family predicted phage terminase small subunit
MPAGRPPKPIALKKLAGNPGKRKLNQAEPQFAGAPSCPEWLNADAKVEWNRVVKELFALDMLRAVDTAALAAYCQSYSRWMSAEMIVDKEGQTVREPVVNKAGQIVAHKMKRHPATIIAKDEKASMHRAASLFGFDPSSRSRINVGEREKEDPFVAFMAGLTNESHDQTYADNTR